jgi:hypothetical protein
VTLTENNYFDLIEMANLAHEKYGWAGVGEDESFFHAIQQGEYGQETLAWIEMPDDADDDEALAEHHNETYIKAIRTIQQMVRDGHLPDQPEYHILVWW